jgi:hypothetical protein
LESKDAVAGSLGEDITGYRAAPCDDAIADSPIRAPTLGSRQNPFHVGSPLPGPDHVWGIADQRREERDDRRRDRSRDRSRDRRRSRSNDRRR